MKTPPCTYSKSSRSYTFAAWQRQLAAAVQDFSLYQSLQRQWKRSLAGMALLLALSPALAAVINVGPNCSLVDALNAANTDIATGGCSAGSGSDTIILPPNSTQTLTKANNSMYGPTGLPVITSDIILQGNGSTIARSTAPETSEFRILAVSKEGDLSLQDTTITGGRIPVESISFHDGGGGIASYGGTVTLTNCTITGNSSLSHFGLGGGVYNGSDVYQHGGTLTLTNSTISDNRAGYAGGGLYTTYRTNTTITNSTISGNSTSGDGGGVYNDVGVLTLTNSTISGNSAGEDGGGLSTGGITHTTVINGTISGNSAGDNGGGVENRGILILSRTLISGNTANSVQEVYNNAAATITANDGNLFGHSGLTNTQAFFGFTPGAKDITATSNGTNPTALSAILQVDSTGVPVLQDNGGLTETLALVAGSPAIDAAPDSSCPPPAIDQRGVSRPVDGDDNGTAECDIGAFGFGVALSTINSPSSHRSAALSRPADRVRALNADR